MEGIRVQLATLQDGASMIRMHNTALYELCSQMKQHMNELSGLWVSDGSEMIRMKFMAFSSQFDICREVIEQYAAFLDRAVMMYDNTESAITTNASSFH